MRLNRIAFLLLAVYFLFIAGSAYYTQIFAIRVFHHLFATLVFGGWLALRLRRDRGLPNTPLNPLIYLLVGVWLLAAVTGLDPRVSLESLWFPLLHLLIFFVLADMLARGRQFQVFETQFIIAALVVVMAGLQFASWYLGLGLFPGTSVGWLEMGILIPSTPANLYFPLGVTTWLAAYVTPLAVIAAAWAQTARRRDYRVVLWGLAIALLIVLALANSRGGLISLAGALVTFTALRLLGRLRTGAIPRGRLIAALGGVAALILVIGAVVLFISREGAGRPIGDSERVEMWGSALNMLVDHPALGVGPQMFGRGYRLYRDPVFVEDRISTSHNAYLNAAAENGLVGVALMIAFGVVIVRRWWGLRAAAPTPGRVLRLDAAMAALVGFGAQSLFDTFTMTPLVALMLLLVAYCTVDLNPPPAPSGRRERWAAVAALALLVIYAVGLLQADRAHSAFNRSLRDGGLEDARAALALDPSLRLYALQVDYLTAAAAAESGDLEAQIAAYEHALALEPTWDTGWINLAALEEQRGDQARALAYLERARAISWLNPASLQWARLAEANAAAPAETIVEVYLKDMIWQAPYSDWWGQTPLRRQAVEQYVADPDTPPEVAFRVIAIHDPERLASIVPAAPVTASDWWITGEYALTVEGDPEAAAEHFSRAIELSPRTGDYYAARARARVHFDRAGAERDLDFATLFGPRWESPAQTRIALAEDAAERHRLRVSAVAPRVIDQNFEGVLYLGRGANFQPAASMRRPGPGTALMRPWYDIAAEYETAGDLEGATNVYRAILEYAPGESLAAEALARLSGDA